MKKLNLKTLAHKSIIFAVIAGALIELAILILGVKAAWPRLIGAGSKVTGGISGGNVPQVNEKLFNEVSSLLQSKQPALEIIDQNRVDLGKQNLGKEDPFAP